MVDLANVTPLSEAGEWPATIPQIEDGWYPTGGPVDPAADSGIANWQSQLLARRSRILKDRLDQLTRAAAVTVTVGPGGQHPTMNAALAELSSYRMRYVTGGAVAQIRLLAGFVMREQIVAGGINLGWIRIVGDEAQTQISRQHLTSSMLGNRYPAFVGADGGVLPAIMQLFEMDSTGAAAGRDGILLVGASTGVRVGSGSGVKRAGGTGIYARGGASATIGAAIFDMAGENGVWASSASIQAESVVASNCAGYGLLAERGAIVSAPGADLSGCALGGIRATAGANVSALSANCRIGGADAPGDISVTQGSIIAANLAVGGTSVSPNTPAASGIIFK